MLSTATNDLRLSAGATEATVDKRNAPNSTPSGVIRGYTQEFLDLAPPPTAKQRAPDSKSMRYSHDCHLVTPIINSGLLPLIISSRPVKQRQIPVEFRT
jgi:hypothetical protein